MEKYLSRCLDSVCNNTYKNLEIICINDGSTDSSLTILNGYARRDERIIVIDQDNKKLSASRNAGLDAAKGSWIAFIDPDDWVHPRYFELLLDSAKKTGADISICNAEIVNYNDVSEEPLKTSKNSNRVIYKRNLNKDHIAKTRVWAKLYRKDIIGDLRFVPGTEPMEDKCFNALVFSEEIHYCMTDHALYYYYVREDSAVQTYTGRQSLASLPYLMTLIKKETSLKEKRNLIKLCYKILLSTRYLEMFSKDYQVILKQANGAFAELNAFHKYLDLKDQIIYGTLYHCPMLYRAWRLCNDPTLLQFEERQKARNDRCDR